MRSWPIKPPLSWPINRAHPHARGLVGFWAMREGGGIGLADDIGQLTGTFTAGPTWGSGMRGPALSFVTDDYVALPTASASALAFIHQTQLFSISLWAMHLSANSAEQALLGNTASSSDKGFYISVNNSPVANSVNVRTTIGDGVRGYGVRSAAGTFPADTWHHICCTGTDAGLFTIYIDGAFSTSFSDPKTTTGDATRALNFGRFNYAAFQGYLSGALDDVRIYSRALSAAEVQDLYINPLTIFLPRRSPSVKIPGSPYYYRNFVLGRA